MSEPVEINPVPLTPEEAKARESRNRILALCLVGFVALIIAVTMVRLKDGVAREQDWQAAKAQAAEESTPETPQGESGEAPQ